MSEISKYVIVDAADQEEDYEYDKFDEAKAEAERRGKCAVIERKYVYDDSELVWTPNNEMTWPPSKRKVSRSK